MQKRAMGAVIVILGVALLLVGANTFAWWTASDSGGSFGLGLRGAEACAVGHCVGVSYEKMMSASAKVFVTFGNMAFYGAFVVAALAIITLAFAFTVRKERVPVSPARITALVGGVLLIVSIAFVISRPSDGGASVGYSMFLYMIGALAATVGAAMLTNSSAASAPLNAVVGTQPAPMVRGAIPACPSCRAPTEWVVEHSRFFCKRCNVYV